MTTPSASRPGLAPAPDADGSGEFVAGPPAGAVSLADLVAETGPLPADAALECVQRLAERLCHRPAADCTFSACDVLLDDDGEVWLRETSAAASAAVEPVAGMEPLGRLLMFLVQGRDGRPETADLPVPVAGIARRLFSKNGAGYRTYSDLAREVKSLRGTEEPVAASASEPAAEEVGTLAAEPRREPAPRPEALEPTPAAVDVVPPASAPIEPLVAASVSPRANAATDAERIRPARNGATGGLGWVLISAATAAAAAGAWMLLR